MKPARGIIPLAPALHLGPLSHKGGLDMFEPSTWWAPDERQRVVTELTETLKRHASTGKAISGQAAYDWAHRIYLVLNETASFL